jgi:hypothetical protein
VVVTDGDLSAETFEDLQTMHESIASGASHPRLGAPGERVLGHPPPYATRTRRGAGRATAANADRSSSAKRVT